MGMEPRRPTTIAVAAASTKVPAAEASIAAWAPTDATIGPPAKVPARSVTVVQVAAAATSSSPARWSCNSVLDSTR
jgi:hypothetical protein